MRLCRLPCAALPTSRIHFAFGFVVALMLFVAGPARAADARISFNRDIRPILSDNCLYCHGPDKNHRKAKLRLDDHDSAIETKAIVPGDVGKSELIARIFSTDPKELMPPPETHKVLTGAQRELLKRWIAAGAVYEPHWAYIAPQRPALPAVKNAAWVHNPIDAFILATLESRQIAPSPEADKATLLRRLSLDLIGLPPTPEETSAFLADASPGAYEKQVDRLLASPHFGERMAVPWLDAVRFADTVGFHGDQNQNVFPYRDYVINAFNTDKPFDQFTIQQLAGDLLPNPTTEDRVATGFNRLTMMTREGGAQAKEYLAKYTADRVRTVAAAWLGSTMNCCECHNHKYDPFTAKDFYSLGAFWADVKQWGVYTSYKYTPVPELAGYTNEFPFPPEIKVHSAYLEDRIFHKLYPRIDQVCSDAAEQALKDPARQAEFETWRQQIARILREHPEGWMALAPASGKAGIASAASGVGPTIVFTEKGKDRVEFSLPAGPVGAIRLTAVPGRNGRIVTGDATSAMVKLAASVKAVGGKESKLAFYFADAVDKRDYKFDNGYAGIGILGGWKTDPDKAKSPQSAVYLLEAPYAAAAGDRLVIDLPGNMLAGAAVAVSPVALVSTDPSAACFADLKKQIVAGSGGAVYRAYILSTGVDPKAVIAARKIYKEIQELRGPETPTLVTEAVTPRLQRILARGNWQDETGEIVVPAVPHFLPQPTSADGRRLNRLDLARWLISPQNPLTSRAVINRMWKQFFGNGLTNVVEDLGSQGEVPSHPELLDWLAVEFRDPAAADPIHPHAWDVKHMVRLIVTSATYRQGSSLRREFADADPNNRLLASQNPRRLEAEFVRDNALYAAGLLNLDIGGPSSFPYQPAGYYANIQFPNRDWINDTDDRQYRRGLYTHWQRTFLHPMLANFDAPSREDSNCTRNVSNTPQQALTLLNDPEFVQAARVLAEHVMSAGSTDDARLEALYQRALCRPIQSAERESLLVFLGEQRGYFKDHATDAERFVQTGLSTVPTNVDVNELAAWSNVCRVVINLHEMVTRY